MRQCSESIPHQRGAALRPSRRLPPPKGLTRAGALAAVGSVGCGSYASRSPPQGAGCCLRPLAGVHLPHGVVAAQAIAAHHRGKLCKGVLMELRAFGWQGMGPSALA